MDKRPLRGAIDALDGMEPELRQLRGLMLTLRLIVEAADYVEPLAISRIARSASASLSNLDQVGAQRLTLFERSKNVRADLDIALDYRAVASIAL